MKKTITMVLGACFVAFSASAEVLLWAEEFDDGSNIIADFGDRYNETISGGILSGIRETSPDPQIRSLGTPNNPVIDVSAYDEADLYLEIRMKQGTLEPVEVGVGTAAFTAAGANTAGSAGTGLGTQSLSAVDTFEVLTWTGIKADIAGGDDIVRSIRIDPMAAAGTTFEMDYIRLYAVPEPATLGMIGAMGVGMLFIRRRFMM